MSVAQSVKWSKWQFTSGFGKLYPKLSYIRICLNFFSKICFYRTLWRKPTSFWGRSPADPQYVTTHPRWVLAIFKILKYCKWNPFFIFFLHIQPLTPHCRIFSIKNFLKTSCPKNIKLLWRFLKLWWFIKNSPQKLIFSTEITQRP